MNVLQLAPELSLVSVPQAGSMLFSRALPKLNMTSMCFCRVGSALARLEVLNNTARQYRQEVERLQEEVGKLQQVLSDVYNIAYTHDAQTTTKTNQFVWNKERNGS